MPAIPRWIVQGAAVGIISLGILAAWSFDVEAGLPYRRFTLPSAVQQLAGQDLSVANLTVTADAGIAGNVTIGGSATFTTPGPNLGGTVTGSWGMHAPVYLENTDFGSFAIASSATNVKFRQVACQSVAGTGIGSGTLAIRNVTDGTNLCTGAFDCTITAPAAVFDCNQAPTAGKVYAIRQTVACTTQPPVDLSCSVEIAH